jgi:hypothetical protein
VVVSKYEVKYSSVPNIPSVFRNDLAKYPITSTRALQLYLMPRNSKSLEITTVESVRNARDIYRIFKAEENNENFQEIGSMGGVSQIGNVQNLNPLMVIDNTVDLERKVYKFTSVIESSTGLFIKNTESVRNICLRNKDNKIYWNHFSTSKDTLDAVYNIYVYDTQKNGFRNITKDPKSLSFDLESDKSLFTNSDTETFSVTYVLPVRGISVISNNLKLLKK